MEYEDSLIVLLPFPSENKNNNSYIENITSPHSSVSLKYGFFLKKICTLLPFSTLEFSLSSEAIQDKVYTSSSINYGPKTSFTPTIVPCHAQLQWDAGGSNSGKQYPQL